MDWIRLRGALIRAFWTFVFPTIGLVVTYLLEPGRLQEFGVSDGAIAMAIGAVLYGLKRMIWPNTVL